MIKKILFLCVLVMSTTRVSYSQPSVEFTVMHGPGGVSDITTRHIASNLNQSYNVVNRPGGAGRIAINHLMAEKTIMLATMVQVYVTNPINFTDLGYDPFTDLEILSVVGVMPSALACHNKTNIKSFEDFLQTKQKLTFGVGGYGSSEHLATATLFSKTNSSHVIVPYPQGGNRSVADLVGGHIDCMFANFPTIKPFLNNDNLVLLMTSHESTFKVPSWNSLYKDDFPFQSYLSIVTSRSMSDSTKNLISSDLERSFRQEKSKEKLIEIGLAPLLYTDKKKIQDTENYMKQIKNFIIENKIKTSN